MAEYMPVLKFSSLHPSSVWSFLAFHKLVAFCVNALNILLGSLMLYTESPHRESTFPYLNGGFVFVLFLYPSESGSLMCSIVLKVLNAVFFRGPFSMASSSLV